MIDYFFQLKVNLEDKLPSTVCEGCYEFVERTWQFKEQVDRAQILLTDILNAVEALSTNVVENRVHELPVCDPESKFEIVDPTLLTNQILNDDQKNFKQEPHNVMHSNVDIDQASLVHRPEQKSCRPLKKVLYFLSFTSSIIIIFR